MSQVFSATVAGAGTTDIVLSKDTKCETKGCSVALSHPARRNELSLNTLQPVRLGDKADLAYPIQPRMLQPMIGQIVPGGGGFNVTIMLAKECARLGIEADLQFVDTSQPTLEIAAACRGAGIRHIPVPRHSTPVNVLAQAGDDKLVFRSPIASASNGLSARHHQRIAAAAAGKQAIVGVSMKDPLVAKELWQLANGARCYFQPTGSLPPELTLELAGRAHVFGGNLAELDGLVTQLAGPTIGVSENDPVAPARALTALCFLFREVLQRGDLAFCTLGRCGSVLLSRHGEAFHTRIEFLNSPGPVTRSGCGDLWLALLILYLEVWATPGTFRIPSVAAATRASCRVAQWLGLRSGQYTVTFSPLPMSAPALPASRRLPRLAALPAAAHKAACPAGESPAAGIGCLPA